jgi:hypothetical protein
MATPRYASSTNVFIPQATGQAIAFVRDKSRFKINQYWQTVRSDKQEGGHPVCAYAFLDPDEPIRVVTDEEYDWPYGQKRPEPKGNIGNFKWELVRMFRRWYGYQVDQGVVDNAEGWNPKAFFDQIQVTKAMTNATKRCVDLIENSSNWGGNTATAAALSGITGCRWDLASNDDTNAQFLAIKKTLTEAVVRVNLSSNGMVQPSDMLLVISPDLALLMANTSEIHTYLEKSPFAKAQLRGDEPSQNGMWGLPDQLYGIKIVVEDASRVNVRPAADGTVATLKTQKLYVKNKTTAVLCSRPGSLDGSYGSPSFSTLQRYYHKWEMAIEARRDDWNKIQEAGVIDCFKEVLAAPQSGFLMTSVVPA